VDQESILRSVNISNWLSANSHRKYARPVSDSDEPRKLTQKLTARWEAAREVSSCQTCDTGGIEVTSAETKVHANSASLTQVTHWSLNTALRQD
jgi:hypothetical protein